MEFRKKIKLKISLMVILTIGILGGQKAYAKTTNLGAVQSLYPGAVVKQAIGTGDITGELAKILKDSKSGETVIIYITSGNYTLGDNGNLLLHTNNIIVMENDTNISKSSGSKAIFRTSASENAHNIQIIGGKLDANGKAAIEINHSYNVTVRGTKITDAQYGVRTTESAVNLQSIEVSNSTRGIYVTKGSHMAVSDSTIKQSKEDGLVVAGASVAKIDTSSFLSNKWRGISATGAGTQLYLSNSTCSKNGTEPKVTAQGLVGHGIGITTGAYGDIENSSIAGNKECGISVFNGSKVELSGNTISKNGRHGIGARKNVVLVDMRDNQIISNGYNGILVADNSSMASDNDQVSWNKGIGISIVDASRVSLENANITKNKSSNIWLSVGSDNKPGAYLNLIAGNMIQRAQQGDGIGVASQTLLKITGADNTIAGNTRHGIMVGVNANVEIVTGKVALQKNGGDGIYLNGAKGTIKNATASSNKNNGIAVLGKSNVKIEHVTTSSNRNNGIAVLGKSNVTIGQVTASSNRNNGIAVCEKSDARIKNATASLNKRNGIEVWGGSTARIEAAVVKNNVKNGIAVSGKQTKANISKGTMSKNHENGILISNKAEAAIKTAVANNNVRNGIAVSGKQTKANISKGTMLKNHENGILISNKAESIIKTAKVEQNRHSGVCAIQRAKVTTYKVKANKNSRYGVNAETKATVIIKKLSAKGNKMADTHKSHATLK
ncbi:right-handed parallel beta-helix repeat-containing protein [Lachnospiraceae bacterium ZAX-1]